jgi:hypothetical protein
MTACISTAERVVERATIADRPSGIEARECSAGIGHTDRVDLPYPCVCCGYRTLEESPGSHEVCPVWLYDVRYRHWEVHRMSTTATRVELEVATRVDEDGYYITALIVVRWSPAAGA